MKALEGKTALVTGGAVRIGRAISLALSERGARVVVHYRNSAREAAELARHIRSRGGEAWRAAGDLEREGAADELMRTAIGLAGAVDLLVNNAALFHRDSMATLTEAGLREEFQVNFFAPLLLTAALARQGRDGQAIHLLDRRIASLDPDHVSYTLAKKALAEATRLCALALAPRIRVNAVAPGPALPPPGEAPDYLKEKAGPIPLGRPADPEAIAEAVCFLATQPGVTGQVLYVDGGQHLLGSEPTGRARA